MLNRRRFVCGVVSFGAFGLGLSTKSGAVPWSTAPSLRGPLSRDVFLALRQETFTAFVDHRHVPVVLTTVTDHAGGSGAQQFTVLFQAPRDLSVGHGAWTLRHRTAGTTELYLQPAGGDGQHRYYRASFNLLS